MIKLNPFADHGVLRNTVDPLLKPIILTREQLKEHSKQLAYLHETGSASNRFYGSILSSLYSDERILSTVYTTFSQSLTKEKLLLPSSTEWLLDNYYVISEQIQTVKKDLTKGFYKDLVKLKTGPLKDYPRIYSIAHEILIHTDNRVDNEILLDFILSYESVSPLTSAELWALPIMLRLIWIENLRILMEKAAETFKKRKLANEWVHTIAEFNSSEKKDFNDTGLLFHDIPNQDSIFLIWVLRSLRDKDHVASIIHRLEQYIEEEDINIEEVVKAENQKQAANRVSTGNAVTSMRLISSIDWSIFFEKVSLVERILEQDPAGIYLQMDFISRDRYRHAVELFSRYSTYNEQEIARRAIKLAANSDGKKNHVGYYLIDQGVADFKKNIGYSAKGTRTIIDLVSTFPTLFYLTIFSGLTLFGSFLLASYFSSQSISPLWALIGIIPISIPALGILNIFITTFYPPTTPPKLELKDGIPDAFRTVVVVPCMIGSVHEIQKIVSTLERRYLTNKDKNLYFSLLTDFQDSENEQMPHEEKLIAELKDQIETLNGRYHTDRENIFYLLHRPRTYSTHEKVWMGWERKRGKLEEFNRLLRGDDSTHFSVLVGNIALIRTVRYVITLDADTQMPLNTAIKLVGTMAHPLNHPEIDTKTNRVISGYGIIQPRVDVNAPSAAKSIFTRVFAADAGLDPYHSVISNVYQDFFHNAVYIGKAIYDVEAFHRCLDSRFPDNRLLSHDLLEGNFLRVGLASDIELLEDFPASYTSFSIRQRRWIQGDWQAFAWLFDTSLGWQEKWKIVDNIRRSLIIPSGVFMLLVGWWLLPSKNIVWSIFTLGVIFFPLIEIFFASITSRLPGEDLKNYIPTLIGELKIVGARVIISIAFMGYETARNMRAIFVAIYRTSFHKKGTLEWTSHAVAEQIKRDVRGMYTAVIVGVFTILWWLLFNQNHSAFPLLIPLLWIFSPLIAYVISKPEVRVIQRLSLEQNRTLRNVAFQTWRFFDEYANTENNYLPPDNIQISPGPTLARRTSPTNIGLSLLSSISAYDFGFINMDELYERLSNTFNTLDKLEKHQGHFLNWYKTDTLLPLQPAYISTVDSGNLATALIAVKQACLEISKHKNDDVRIQKGLATAWNCWIEEWFRLTEIEHTSELPVRLTVPKRDQELRRIIEKAVKEIEKLQTDYESRNAHSYLGNIEKFEKDIEPIVGISGINAISYWRKKVDKLTRQSLLDSTTTKELWTMLAGRSGNMAVEMNFRFLFNTERNVFSIGFNLSENKTDDSYYNLLATEARLASFIAIALGQVPEDHWFALGRPLTKVHGKTVLLSWGGTIFEYLMPQLLMKNFDNTLLWQSNETIVERQIEYARSKSIPWGISESGFFAFDYQYNYQYQQFGIPSLSLKTELSENLVVAPYATLLSLPIRALDAYKNLEALNHYGLQGTYGYYEAADFTDTRLPNNEKIGIVKSYMAHHQGMSLVALNNYFHSNLMQHRFHNDPIVEGAELLLAERIPTHIPKIEISQEALVISRDVNTIDSSTTTHIANTDTVRTTILSNSEYSVVLTNAGTGVSTWKDLDITRNTLDTSENNFGWFCFIKDLSTSAVWSATYQPFLKKPDHYSAKFSPFKAEFDRTDDELDVRTNVVVSMNKNVEIRELTLTNRSKKIKKLEITDYAEVVASPHRADITHPAFGKLFVESEYDSVRQSLTFKRRSRSIQENEVWVWHTLRGNKDKIAVSEYETDRNAFLGRGNTLLTAQALNMPLTQTVGATFDPIMSLRTKIILKPNEHIKLNFMTGVTESKMLAENQIDQFADPGEVERTFTLSEIHSQIELRHLGITFSEAKQFQRLGSKILYPDRSFRAPKEILEQNIKSQSGLYPYGISGDYPIVLTKIRNKEGLKLIKQVLLAHEFLRTKQVIFDLIILNEESLTYSGDLKEKIQSLIDTSLSRPQVDKPGGIFVRDSSFLAHTDKILFETTARVIFDSQWGTLEDNFELIPKKVHKQKIYDHERIIEHLKPLNKERSLPKSGMNPAGNEYLIHIHSGETPPLPWSNVIANQNFGTLVTAGGLGFTWAHNSQLNRLTTWSNDPVTEKPGEVLYLKDESGWWSTTPLPTKKGCTYTVSHGWGYTKYLCNKTDHVSETTVWVDEIDSVKIVLLKLTNKTARKWTVSPVFFAELVLADNRERNQFFIVSEKDPVTGALTARNSYSDVYFDQLSFLQSTVDTTHTTDRVEFLGRGGSWTNPTFLEGNDEKLTQNVGAGLDPAFIMKTEISIDPGEEKELAFILGQGSNREEYTKLAQKYKILATVRRSFEQSKNRFHDRLTKITIKTPDANLNTLTNGWLPYQVLSGRFWGRSSFFQSGGAFGFRDQLQDILALLYSDPKLAREHILYSAEHQFIQGDVMHWWHPKTTRGVRTRISDDFLWLPYAVAQYIAVTNDTGILHEKVSFMDLSPLLETEMERYDEAVVTKEKTSLYIHCIRALENGMETGSHGLPLIGTGDWNDGFNAVGMEGKGESIWLAWFHIEVYGTFSKICKTFGDADNAAGYSKYTKQIKLAADKYGWDGDWYKRAFFDNGSPLGSKENSEGTIDSISQTWSVISGGAPEERGKQALDSVEKYLVRQKEKLILLLTPPFSNSKPFPGYIQGYLPGTRENGGQYTHAAAWLPLAYTKLGNGDRAVELLDLLNPLTHTDTQEKVQKYKGEPYVLAGDVYSHPQHIGRVGWSWYTGSAAWMYRTIIEHVIGLNLSGDQLSFKPCVPKHWNEFSLQYQWKDTVYNILFSNPSHVSTGVIAIKYNSRIVKNKSIQLVNDKNTHHIQITMGN